MTENKTYIYGKHALMEALANVPEAVESVFITKNFDDAEILSLIKKRNVSIASKLSGEVLNEAVHQGIVGILSLPRLMRNFREFADGLKIESDTSLVLLDELQDPQNVGAVIRSAAAFGLSGVLIPERNQAQVTGAVVKVSAGMAFKIPLVSVGNVNSVVRDLKDRGFAAYGLAGNAKYTVTKEFFELPTLFILGNESEGLREKTAELCDKLLSIPINPKCESLNAAASAAVAFYAWSAKHSEALRPN
jgi:23S rRNA (guanosine2251-2'-O)-methyltransferase